MRAARKALGLNQAEFAKQIGLTQTSLSMLEMGNNAITDKNVKLICITFNVNEHWLRTGEGKMFNSSPYVKEISDILVNLTPETQQYLLLMAQGLLNVQQKLLDRHDMEDAQHSEEETDNSELMGVDFDS
jgi:transcriptional regulator with XRE-family HTH domain